MITQKSILINKPAKSHLHFITSISGSIWEISNDLLPMLEEEFVVTKEWKYELPVKKEILLCHFLKVGMFLEPDIFDSFQTKILIQPIDGTRIKKDVVNMLNCFDLIFTPGESGKNIMELNGVGVPIKVIPNYYKKDIFEKKIYTDIEKHIPKNKTIFYHESSFHPRKGVELLYEGFVRAFGDTEEVDRVVLVVKDLPYTQQTYTLNEALKKQTICLQKQYKKAPLILKFSSFINEDDLKTLWNLTDIYVSLAKIEGFGIPMLRMFLMNKPIIALNNPNSGYVDYLTNNNSYLIDCLNVPANNEFMWLYEKETEWGVPNISEVIKTFRTCLEDYKKDRIKSMKVEWGESYETYFEKYSLKTVSDVYLNAIKEIHRTTKIAL